MKLMALKLKTKRICRYIISIFTKFAFGVANRITKNDQRASVC